MLVLSFWSLLCLLLHAGAFLEMVLYGVYRICNFGPQNAICVVSFRHRKNVFVLCFNLLLLFPFLFLRINFKPKFDIIKSMFLFYLDAQRNIVNCKIETENLLLSFEIGKYLFFAIIQCPTHLPTSFFSFPI